MSASSPSAPSVAVTGAGGFIGSHLTHLMLREGHHVRALVHYNAMAAIGHLAEVIEIGKAADEAWVKQDRLQIVHGDILDERCVRDLVRGRDQVFHLAALIGIPYSYRAPSSYLRVNTLGTLNVLEACREENPERVIVTSTSEVYGSAREIPIREQHLLQAQSPYAASKAGSDKMAEAYFLSFDLPVATLRPFNTFGPRQSMRAIVPTILAQALCDDCPEIRLGSLDPIRDLTYVEDAAAGYLALSRAPLDRMAGRLYNLGTGQGHSIAEIAELAMKAAGVDKPVVSSEERKRPASSEVARLVCDASRLRSEIGWEPRTTLLHGLEQTARWVKDHLDSFDPENYRI
ncbi:GDP-mannose 4,6-dehydratase [Candidatus Sumerlaeota bacterium]|nr:GDP-mannose 4,6-dehydratase [Candidatus Sumerlaeota bacterium]